MVCKEKGVWLEIQYLTLTLWGKEKKKHTICLVAKCRCMWSCWQAK